MKAPLEKQMVEAPLFEQVPLEGHVVRELLGCVVATVERVILGDASGGEAPLESVLGAPLEEEGYCQQEAGTGSLPGLPYKCDYPARVFFSLVAVVGCDAWPG